MSQPLFARPLLGDADVAAFLRLHAELCGGSSALVTFSALYPLKTMCGFVTPSAAVWPGQPEFDLWLKRLGRGPDEAAILQFIEQTTGVTAELASPMPSRPGEVGIAVAESKSSEARELAAAITQAILNSRVTHFHLENGINHVLEQAVLSEDLLDLRAGSLELSARDVALHRARVGALIEGASAAVHLGSLKVLEAVHDLRAVAVTPWLPTCGLNEEDEVALPDVADIPPPPAAATSTVPLSHLIQAAWRRRRRLSGVIAGTDRNYLVIAVPYGVGRRSDRPAGIVLHAVDHAEASRLGDYEIAFESALATWLGRIAAERRLTSTITNLVQKLTAAANPDRALRAGIGRGVRPDHDDVFERCDERLRSRLDVKLLLESLPDILHEVRTLCNATSCTFRLLTGDQTSVEHSVDQPERWLRRVYSEGGTQWGASPWELPISQASHSVNAWVARNGSPVYLRSLPIVHEGGRITDASCPDLALYEGLETVAMFRDEIRSELCVPVFAEDRLVGTLNIESPETGAFDQVALSVEEYAQVIGIALLEARRRIAVEVMESAGGLLDQLHELAGEVMSAREEVGKHQAELEPALAGALLDRLKIIQSMTELKYEVPEVEALPQRQLVREVIHEAMLGRSAFASEPSESHLEGGVGVGLLDAVLDAEQAGSLRFALAQAFANVNKHYDTPVQRRPRRPSHQRPFTLQLFTMVVGGETNLVVRMQSPLTASAIKNFDPQRLFREPLPDPSTGRVRLGAYLAGEVVRRRGGSACARVIPETSRTARLMVEFAVPLPVTRSAQVT